jgi:hypothetical protein
VWRPWPNGDYQAMKKIISDLELKNEEGYARTVEFHLSGNPITRNDLVLQVNLSIILPN